MIEKGKTYVVMGVLDSDSLAYYIGKTIQDFGGNVIYTAQNERMKKLFFDRSKKMSDEEKSSIEFKYCDVTVEEEVKALFEDIGTCSGVVHSIAYANPKTSLGEEFHTDAVDDLKMAFHISSLSLATVSRYAVKAMPEGGSILGMTFDTRQVYPLYNWMGVCKSALEAVGRALARRHGTDMVRYFRVLVELDFAFTVLPILGSTLDDFLGQVFDADLGNRITLIPHGQIARGIKLDVHDILEA